jgi:glutathione S-transferase
MKYPILYSFRRCPYAMRARIALKYSEVTYIHREIKLSNRPNELYKISPKGTVPVMMISEKKVIEESIDIMHYALQNKDLKNLYKSNLEKQDNLIKKNDDQFKKALDRYKYHIRFKDKSYEFYQKDIAVFLNEYEIILRNQKYLINEYITLSDYAIFPFIRQCAHVDLVWFKNNFEHLVFWLEELKSSELFLSIMKKYDIWSEGVKDLIVKND